MYHHPKAQDSTIVLWSESAGCEVSVSDNHAKASNLSKEERSKSGKSFRMQHFIRMLPWIVNSNKKGSKIKFNSVTPLQL